MPYQYITASSSRIACGTSNTLLMQNSPLTAFFLYKFLSDNALGGRVIEKSLGGNNGVGLLTINSFAFQFQVNGGGQLTRATTQNTTSVNVWNRVVLTWDGTTTAANAHFYVNGVEPAYQTTANGSSPFAVTNGTISIGNRLDNIRPLAGNLSELAIWNVVLDSGEIANLSQSRIKGLPYQIRPSALKAYWPLDDFANGINALGSGSIIERSGNGLNGSPTTNAPTGVAEEVLTY